MESWQQNGHTFYRVTGRIVHWLRSTSSSSGEAGESAIEAVVKEITGKSALLSTLDYATRSTTSGASAHATASRTSRSTC